MKKKIAITGIMLVVFLGCLEAQNLINPWIRGNESEVSSQQWKRSSIPKGYDTYSLDIDALSDLLQNVPSRHDANSLPGVLVTFPTINGEMEGFEVYDATVLSDELQAESPNIRSYIGKSLDKENKIIRFSITVFGLSAIILNDDGGTQYLDCITKDRLSYMMYAKKDIHEQEQILCHVDDSEFNPIERIENDIEQLRNPNDGSLREFRLALTTTQEVSNYYIDEAGVSGANDTIKKTVVLSALNQIMTRINAVYEIELGLTMRLITDNRDLIFLSENDGLTSNSLGLLLNENQVITDTLIGSANYDIGHVLCTDPGGLAQLFSPCTSNKARGASGPGFSTPTQPSGFAFEGIIMHELGHQYGAFHTWSAPSCAGTYSDFAAVEPGGGTTIMSYAGICGADANIQNDVDLYFHQNSIDEIWSNITAGNSTCAQQTLIDNQAPIANAGGDFTIPLGTPFKLSGFASDDGEEGSLTYNWEQIDVNGPEAIPTNTTLTGPVVRSFPPSTNRTRYVPRLEDYIGQVNNSTDWEKLMLVERDLNFAFTVRDNDLSGGQSESNFMTVSITDDSGPFTVTSQNEVNLVYQGNTIQTVTWNVANSNAAPTSTTSVNILLSTDGGITFDTVILSGTPNDGSEDIIIPDVNSTSCRIMVEAVDNIFYNINVRDFEIEESLSLTEFLINNSLMIFPNPSHSGQFNVAFKLTQNMPIKMDVYDIRGRLIFRNMYNPTTEFSEVVDLKVAQSGIYLMTISYGNKEITKKIIVN